LDQVTLEQELQGMDDEIKFDTDIPIKIIHVMSSGKSYNQSKQLQKLLAHTDISPTYIVPEKKQQLGNMMEKFFNQFEKVL
jgi:hypothetical protein